ncbi:hypothetical protein BCR33DRAFT_720458 [Rhizoclosmatium globosum]|uniref:G-protein coupled receptors family 3 profile domain-containing protein n=1 Tax=Rhizoclosmatium globosum TaxID=329046 RepID=A0A1Y2BVX5_9FUNG|nr:hypothetical protein BCR33DRAFT_720458 [Rhizoclosmatium globosum]|eukprot:ORY38777.1 hypothetical protein BCR33DRAFT_720458 [Rhizoclosmatium globosum]
MPFSATLSESTTLLQSQILFGASTFSLGLLLIVLAFIGYYEVWKAHKSCSWTTIGTPFNILLVLGISANTGYNFCEGMAVIRDGNFAVGNEEGRRWRVASGLLEAGWALSYLYFSWIRAEKQIQSVFPKSFRLIRYVFLASPVVLLLPTAIRVVNLVEADQDYFYTHLHAYVQTAAAFAFILLDCVFLYSFTRYLAQTQVEPDSPIDPRFLLISRYGCIASCLCLVLLGFAIFYSVGYDPMSKENAVVGLVSGLTAPLVFAVLFVMKIKLLSQSSRELEIAKQRLMKAKLESDATITVSVGGAADVTEKHK